MKLFGRTRDGQLREVELFIERLQGLRQELRGQRSAYEKERESAVRANDTAAANGADALLANVEQNLTYVNKALTVYRQARDQIKLQAALRPPKGIQAGTSMEALGADLQAALDSLAVYNSEIVRTIAHQGASLRNITGESAPAKAAPADLESKNLKLAQDLERRRKGAQ